MWGKGEMLHHLCPVIEGHNLPGGISFFKLRTATCYDCFIQTRQKKQVGSISQRKQSFYVLAICFVPHFTPDQHKIITKNQAGLKMNVKKQLKTWVSAV